MAANDLIKEFSNLLDKIYQRFLLRDIFAKIVPGLVLIVSFFYLLTDDLTKIEKLTQFSWLILIGLAWIVAFGIQAIGEVFNIIKYYTDNYENDKEWYIEYNKFIGKATDPEKSGCERFVVIKEATGNLSISLFLSTILITLKLLFNDWKVIEKPIFWLAIIFSFLFSIFLIVMHRIHVIRQCEFLEAVNNRRDGSDQ